MSRYLTLRAVSHNPTESAVSGHKSRKTGIARHSHPGTIRYQIISPTSSTNWIRKSTSPRAADVSGRMSLGKYTFDNSPELPRTLLLVSHRQPEKYIHGSSAV